MDEKHLKKCSIHFAIRRSENACWWRSGIKITLLLCWWEWKFVQKLWKSKWQCLREMRINLLYHLAIPLYGIYPKDSSPHLKDTCSTMCTSALLIKSLKSETTLMFLNIILDKENVVNLYYVVSRYFKRWHHDICRLMNGARKKLS